MPRSSCRPCRSRDQVAEARAGWPSVLRGDDPARGAGAHERDRLLARACCDAHHAAVRAQHEQLPIPPRVALSLEAAHVVVDERLQVGVEHGRRRALVLAPARQHLVRERDLRLRPELLDELARAQLVRRVDEREEVGDGDRVDLAAVAQAGTISWRTRSSSSGISTEPSRSTRSGMPMQRDARHEVLRLHPVQVEVVRARRPAGSGGCRGSRRSSSSATVGALALDQRVRRHGRAVDEVRDLVRRRDRPSRTSRRPRATGRSASRGPSSSAARRVSSSKRTRSVKVPPVSTPALTLMAPLLVEGDVRLLSTIRRCQPEVGLVSLASF